MGLLFKISFLASLFFCGFPGQSFAQKSKASEVVEQSKTTKSSEQESITKKDLKGSTDLKELSETQKTKDSLKKSEAEVVKSVPVASKNIEAIKAQNKRATMDQMHKVNKAMRKSMMRHKHK